MMSGESLQIFSHYAARLVRGGSTPTGMLATSFSRPRIADLLRHQFCYLWLKSHLLVASSPASGRYRGFAVGAGWFVGNSGTKNNVASVNSADVQIRGPSC